MNFLFEYKAMRSLMLVLMLVHSMNLSSQSIEPVETPVVWFSIMVDEEMYAAMELDGKTMMALALQQNNPEAKELMDQSFGMFKHIIDSATSLQLLPANALSGKVNYSRMGYPIANFKKAAKNSSFNQFVKVEISVVGMKTSTSTSGVGQDIQGIEVTEENSRIKTFPQVDVILKFAGEDGKSTEKVTGRYRHSEKIKVNTQSIDIGFFAVELERNSEIIPYYFYLNEALKDLINKLPK